MKNKLGIWNAMFFCVLISISGYSQLSIVNANINEYNITTNSLSQISVSNTGGNGLARFELSLTNSANIQLLSGVTAQVELKPGLNVFGANNLKFSSFNFGNTPQADYLKNMHRLSSGAFNYCVRIVPLTGFEEGDEFCQSINTAENEQLFLVNPLDEEVIESTTPILMWMHTEAFNLLGEGEFFRMTLVEVKEGQAPGEAIVNNVPIFIKSYVAKHQVQYPLDAEKLENGKKYAWLVQKIANGTVLASTETWSFSLDKPTPKEHVYVALKKKMDGAVYYPVDNKIYFRFDERYKSSSSRCEIYNDKREKIEPKLDDEFSGGEAIKASGYNSYELDLNPYKLKKGFYTLEAFNEKNEKYLIKFYVD